MATLIKQGKGDRHDRRCDGRCYKGKRDKCACICGGKNHGKGLQTAQAQMIEIAEELAKNNTDPEVRVQAQRAFKGLTEILQNPDMV